MLSKIGKTQDLKTVSNVNAKKKDC